MNAITDIEDIIKIPTQQNTAYFAIYRDKVSDQNRLLDNYKKDDNTIENCERELREYLSKFSKSGCNFEIWFSETPKPLKGGYRIPFYMPANTSIAQPSIGSIAMQSNSIDVKSEVDKALNDFKKQLAFEAMQRENEQLRQQLKDTAPSALDRVIGRLDPMIDFYFKKEFGMNNAIGSTIEVQPIEASEAQKMAEKAIIKLSELRPNDAHFILKYISDWAEKENDLTAILQKLIKLQETEPDKYNMAKSFI